MRQELIQEHQGGMWLWLLQRVTAVVLVVGLAVHLIVLHAFNLGELTFDNVAARVASWFFAAVDLSLLGAGLFHALNGTRMVLLDYGFSGEVARCWGRSSGWWVWRPSDTAPGPSGRG
ncbi:MAG: hypothetical protein M5U22_13690 [Thermoleophilia bacterium]|nr:hypothetical protein [Thermoleophilia bacterium]